MDPDLHLAVAALMNPRIPASGPSKSPSATLFPRLPSVLSDAARLRTGHGLRVWKPVTATLRGNALVLSGAGSDAGAGAGATATVFEVRTARAAPARGRRGALAVLGVDGEEAVLDFGDEARRAAWLAALARVASAEMPELADFEVLRAIGKGGSGEIFLCRRKGDDGLFAMKVLQKYNAFHSDTSLQHSLDERLVLQLAADHPFIVRLRYAFQTERAMYLVTDFVPGGDLRTYLNRHPGARIGEDEARELFAQLLLALEHLHGMGIIHRDIKAENVLLDGDGNVKLCDMGLAKFTGRFGGRTASFCGTPGSMAPEMALRRGKSYSMAIDMWSYGTLLFRCLVGRMPFGDLPNKSPLSRAADDNELLRRIIQDDVRFPTADSGLLSPEARELLEGLLRKDECKRLNSAEIRESAWFEGFDWDRVLSNARSMQAASSSSGSSVSGSSDDLSQPVELENFDLGRLSGVKLNPDELREHGKQRQATCEQGARGKASLLRRVASSSGMRKNRSETSIIGFAMYDGMEANAAE